MMIDAFGEDNTSQLLDDYADAISSAIDALLEQCAIALRGNIDSIIDDMDYFDGDFNAMEDVILEGVGY
ncbi:MAG: hypothetical protein LUE14_10385 [Clostridiales bacterium]|nr:hypothetical protein [Clostridiales bacterium]